MVTNVDFVHETGTLSTNSPLYENVRQWSKKIQLNILPVLLHVHDDSIVKVKEKFFGDDMVAGITYTVHYRSGRWRPAMEMFRKICRMDDGFHKDGYIMLRPSDIAWVSGGRRERCFKFCYALYPYEDEWKAKFESKYGHFANFSFGCFVGSNYDYWKTVVGIEKVILPYLEDYSNVKNRVEIGWSEKEDMGIARWTLYFRCEECGISLIEIVNKIAKSIMESDIGERVKVTVDDHSLYGYVNCEGCLMQIVVRCRDIIEYDKEFYVDKDGR